MADDWKNIEVENFGFTIANRLSGGKKHGIHSDSKVIT